ncbi:MULTISPECIES: alpha-amylase family glycosyl hydrolase [unclassified Novosphingobium]|uniref:alpha-amylase family glycosyl hydrolase n=1 Tax=unclassified Novosphingobium TaxID=2644732 RepID=UPI000869A158|nr:MULTISPECIES: alpha-amylase family glycosyl hydrolase [unclassified Novosphingobium]MBN9145335.1 alpha-amylase [Novosphingobium sp.]MDR6709715.1 glycosidase [Novosphingobium sp. 1748]ODU80288.1 MAG: alpha-amylase [Novosphingobium sp. SCN 63-17]OJX88774.1 MAG: alpha-amylase [Novosphingobium sp. 63-713]
MRRALTMALAALAASAAQGTPLSDLRARTPEQEVIYFVLPDRFANGDPANDTGGIAGDRLTHGFDPADKGFYHGGDLKGLTARLDYIQGLGASAIWVGPIFRNKPVQGAKGHESAGYHGYWITDFLHVDPHFGSDADFAALVEAAHARGMKVYMDIIVNHTADVIQYREAGDAAAPYRSKADYPFSRRGGVAGAPINAGFAGDDDARPANWVHMTDPGFAYTPYVPRGEERVKNPAWLNNPIWYHNRGDTDWKGESAQYGDFVGLDDLATENPRVVKGFIEIYGSWIDRFGIDGYRIDTAKHVNPQFWRAFVPAIQARARARGIPNFHIFGEVATGDYDPALLAGWVYRAGLPAVLDFAFMRAATDAASGRTGTQELARMVDDDALYGPRGALRLPTFLGNHDNGRFAMALREARPGIGAQEWLARDLLGHAMLLTLRGVPTIYYGDEQGFAGRGGDQSSRQDMFASKVAEYNQDVLVGTASTTAAANFTPGHPLYQAIARLAQIRQSTPALWGGRTILRASGEGPGLFAVSRLDPKTGAEVLLAFNTSDRPITAQVSVAAATGRFNALSGPCPAAPAAPGSATISLPAFGYAICAATQ